MGTSYATVRFQAICPKCSHPNVDADAQFYPSVGTFRGDMQEVRLGERLFENSGWRPEALVKYGMGKAFPLIPLFESRGLASYDCPTCKSQEFTDVVVQIKRGVVAWVAPVSSLPEDYELTKGSKNPAKEARRRAAWNEVVRRAHEERVKRLGTTDPMWLMADAMTSPIRRELLFNSAFRNPTRPQFLQMARERLRELRGISDLLKPSRGGMVVITKLGDGEPAEFWQDVKG